MRYLCIFLLIALAASAQTRFNSGSTGADGNLRYSAPPEPRQEFAIAYDAARQETLLFGGDSAGRKNDTWVFDGESWTLRTPQTFPSPRDEVVMAYDSAREVTVLFGGFDEELNDEANDTWEWDGIAWHRIDTAQSPPRRQRAALCFDSARGVMVLYGGDDNGQAKSDTWEYDGNNWSQISVAGPGPRTDASMAFDPVRGETLLFGGSSNGGPSGSRDDTWVYKGGSWVLRTPATKPAIRMAQSMTWNAGRGRILMGFGVNGFGELGDLWEWNGSTWTELHPATQPEARSECGLVYHEADDAMLLFGGHTSAALNDSWYFRSDWSLVERVQAVGVFDGSARADGVWHFRDIHIPAGVTLTVRANAANTPLTWLTTGAATIDGVLDLSAVGSTPGPGGFAGGEGGAASAETGLPGVGPTGGLPGVGASASGTDAARFASPNISPLVGGSGGGGGGAIGGYGGAGGGALLVAADMITVNGSILANGAVGAANADGKGAGGSIKLVANRVAGSGSLQAGKIRFETLSTDFSGTATPGISGALPPALNYLQHLATLPSVRVVAIETAGGLLPVSESAELSFTESGPVTVHLASSNVPENTPLTVRLTARGQVHSASGLADADGNATATLTVPVGFGTIQAFAEFAVP